MQLFRICKTPSCGAAIDPDNIKIARTGAAIEVTALCNNSHVETWSSSTIIGTGRSTFPLVNVEMVCWCIYLLWNIRVCFPQKSYLYQTDVDDLSILIRYHTVWAIKTILLY